MLAVFLMWTCVNAQTTAPTPQKSTSQPVAPKEIDPETLQHRSIALALLQSLAIEARSYRDEPLRARVQARIADVLWDQDLESSRSLFRRAWDAAEALETNVSASGNAVPGRLAKDRPARPRTNLRREILQMAARRDHALGEEFLRKLTAKDQPEQSNDPTRSQMSAAEIAERLRVAGSFLEAGDVGRALQFADPALTRVTTGSIMFLVELHDKNAAAAD